MNRKLSEYSDMSKEEFQNCLKKIDMETLEKDPAKAFSEAGATFKKGVTFKMVDTEEELNALPTNVIPLFRANSSLGKHLSHISHQAIEDSRIKLHQFFKPIILLWQPLPLEQHS